MLAKNSPHGVLGISKTFEMWAPNGFEVVKPDSELVEAVFINKRILKKMDLVTIIGILEDKVFSLLSEGELLKVDFKVCIYHSTSKNKF